MIRTASLFAAMAAVMMAGASLAGEESETPSNLRGHCDYLQFLAERLEAERKAPATLAEWEARRPDVRQKYLKILGLDPMPEKTPLNPQVGRARSGH